MTRIFNEARMMANFDLTSSSCQGSLESNHHLIEVINYHYWLILYDPQ